MCKHKTKMHAAMHGNLGNDSNAHMGESISDSKFKYEKCCVCGIRGKSKEPMFTKPDRYEWDPKLMVCPGCEMNVPGGFLRCPICLVACLFQDKDPSLQFSPTRHVYQTDVPKNKTVNGNDSVELRVSCTECDRMHIRKPICMNARRAHRLIQVGGKNHTRSTTS